MPDFPETVVVTGDELRFLQNLSADAQSFHDAYRTRVEQPTLADYDAAFREWQRSDAPQHDDQAVIETLGALLGNRCVADYDMEWVTVTDDIGTDCAVRSLAYDTMIFPFSSVLKRIEDREHGFLDPIYQYVGTQLSEGDLRKRT